MKLVFKHLLMLISIFTIVYIIVIFNSKEKKEYDTLLIKYRTTCHQIDYLYEIFDIEFLKGKADLKIDHAYAKSKEIGKINNKKEQKDKSIEEVIVSRLNYRACNSGYTTNSTSFIGSNENLNDLFKEIKEENIDKFLTEHNNQEVAYYDKLIHLLDKTMIPKFYLKIDRNDLVKNLNIRKFYIGKKTFFLLEKKIVPKIERYNMKLSLNISLMLYFLGMFLLFCIRNKSLGFYFK